MNRSYDQLGSYESDQPYDQARLKGLYEALSEFACNYGNWQENEDALLGASLEPPRIYCAEYGIEQLQHLGVERWRLVSINYEDEYLDPIADDSFRPPRVWVYFWEKNQAQSQYDVVIEADQQFDEAGEVLGTEYRGYIMGDERQPASPLSDQSMSEFRFILQRIIDDARI